MPAPKVTVPLSPAVEVTFNLATLMRLERKLGKTPVAIINDIAAGAIPTGVDQQNVAEWLQTDAGRAASAKAAEKISPVSVAEFVAICVNADVDQVADQLPIESAYEVYTELQRALVEATKQLLSAKGEDEVKSPPPSAG